MRKGRTKEGGRESKGGRRKFFILVVLATLQVFKSHTWLVATILDSVILKYFTGT